MRRILRVLPLTLLALTIIGGVSFADRGRSRDHRSGGVNVRADNARQVRHDRQDRVRDQRQDRRAERHDRRVDRQDRRADRQNRRVIRQHDRRVERQDRRADRRNDRQVRVQRSRPVYRNNRFYFAGGVHHGYTRPVIRYTYRNYNRRPNLLVENYTPVPGYIWMTGSWSWDGYQWQWLAGHYEVDANYYEDSYYQDSYYGY